MFILVRDIDTFRTNGDREFALKFVKDQGFTLDSNKPLETFQSSKLCDYSKFDVLPNNITALMNYKLPPDVSPPKLPPEIDLSIINLRKSTGGKAPRKGP